MDCDQGTPYSMVGIAGVSHQDHLVAGIGEQGQMALAWENGKGFTVQAGIDLG